MSFFISISTASSDHRDTPITHAITKLAAAVAKARSSNLLPTGPALDLTFMLPGKFEKPDFSGMRMGGYTNDNNTLYFEKAVPEELIYSPQADAYMALVVEDMIANANAFFSSSDMSFDLPAWELLARDLNGSAASRTTH